MASIAVVSTSHRVARFTVAAAVIIVLYQVTSRTRLVSNLPLPSTSPLLYPGDRRGEDFWGLSSSEITGVLLFVGLFSLLQHKTYRDREIDIEVEQRFSAIKLQNQGLKVERSFLPRDVFCELLLFLSPRDLTVCPLVSKAWDDNTGSAAQLLWRRVFQRDFGEPGLRFAQVFPIVCWRQFYFRHHLSRAVELARVLGITQKRKCIVINGQVYDVTDFLDLHPGGVHVIEDAVGTDATLIWDQFRHSNEAKATMQQFLVHDHVLERPKRERLQGNLEVVMARWRKISWALSQSHCFGHMAPHFANAVFRFHLRGVTRKVTA